MGGGAVNAAEGWLLLVLLAGALLLGTRGKKRQRRRGRSRRTFVFGHWWGRGPGAVYRFRVAHPRTGRTVTGYVGQTVRAVQVRIDEHLLGSSRGEPPKPWADTVISWDVLWESPRCTQGWLNWRERYYILTRKPLYNVQWNRANRRRIEPHRQQLQRARRSGQTRRAWRPWA